MWEHSHTTGGIQVYTSEAVRRKDRYITPFTYGVKDDGVFGGSIGNFSEVLAYKDTWVA